MGKIPKGWKYSKFGSFATPKRGKIITKKQVTNGDVPVVAGGLEPSYFHNKSNVQGPVVTISASGANAGFVNLFYNNIWASDCSYINSNMSKYIFISYLFLKNSQKKIYDAQHGAAQPHINPNDLIRLNFIYSTDKIFNSFEDLISPLFNKINILKEESLILTDMRDTLLPKLISGELSISDVKEIVQEAGV